MSATPAAAACLWRWGIKRKPTALTPRHWGIRRGQRHRRPGTGALANASGTGALALWGMLANASGTNAYAAGRYANAQASDAIAIGAKARVSGTYTYGIAVGQRSEVTGAYGIAMATTPLQAKDLLPWVLVQKPQVLAPLPSAIRPTPPSPTHCVR